MIRIAHLETDVTQACQLSCVACNHHVPLYRALGPQHADIIQIERDLTQLATILHADRWGALGGEPLLNPKLTAILQVVRKTGICDKIEVWTNGLLLRRMSSEFWGAFDVLVLSRYPGKHEDSDIEWMKQKCALEGVEFRIIDERVNPNFKTLLEKTPTTPAETKAKFQGCFFRHFSRVANNGYFFTCCCAPHMPKLVNGLPFGTDGVKIDGLTETALRAYLERSEPLQSCTTCAGRDTAVAIPWSEERDPKRWLAASAGLDQ